MDASYYRNLIDSLSTKVSVKYRKLDKYKDYLQKVQNLIGKVSPIALNTKLTESCFEKGAYFVSNETLSHGELMEVYSNLLNAQKELDYSAKQISIQIDELESDISSLESELQNARNELSKLQ